jgi:hypothetical protein
MITASGSDSDAPPTDKNKVHTYEITESSHLYTVHITFAHTHTHFLSHLTPHI